MSKSQLIKPQRLIPGDTIGIIAPAGSVKPDTNWDLVKNYFLQKGYLIKIAPHAKNIKGYLAGNDIDRANDIMDFFADTSIKAIIAARGGYGCYRLLNILDFDLIKANPKIFIGYSDITTLLVSIVEKSNLTTFHGPLAISDFGNDNISEFTEKNFWTILEHKTSIPIKFPNLNNYQCIQKGYTEGQLVCGNLAVLTGLLGTPFFPDLRNKILLLEDIGEPIYKIDRMLTQLKLAGVFNIVKGVLFGEFSDITSSTNNQINTISVESLFKEIFKGTNIPVGYGIAVGHNKEKLTIPIGLTYQFNSEDFQLSLIEEYLN